MNLKHNRFRSVGRAPGQKPCARRRDRFGSRASLRHRDTRVPLALQRPAWPYCRILPHCNSLRPKPLKPSTQTTLQQHRLAHTAIEATAGRARNSNRQCHYLAARGFKLRLWSKSQNIRHRSPRPRKHPESPWQAARRGVGPGRSSRPSAGRSPQRGGALANSTWGTLETRAHFGPLWLLGPFKALLSAPGSWFSK